MSPVLVRCSGPCRIRTVQDPIDGTLNQKCRSYAKWPFERVDGIVPTEGRSLRRFIVSSLYPIGFIGIQKGASSVHMTIIDPFQHDTDAIIFGHFNAIPSRKHCSSMVQTSAYDIYKYTEGYVLTPVKGRAYCLLYILAVFETHQSKVLEFVEKVELGVALK